MGQKCNTFVNLENLPAKNGEPPRVRISLNHQPGLIERDSNANLPGWDAFWVRVRPQWGAFRGSNLAESLAWSIKKNIKKSLPKAGKKATICKVGGPPMGEQKQESKNIAF